MSDQPSTTTTPTTETPASAPASTPSTPSTTAETPSNPTPESVAAAAAAQSKPGEAPAKPEHVDLLNDPKFKEGDKPATDPTKNADGTDKTPEQIETEKKAAEDAAKEAKEKGEKPIEYKPFTTPEDMPIAPDINEGFTAIAQKHKLPQEAAQELIDLGVKTQQKNIDFWNETKAAWRTQVEKDPVLGGQNLKQSVQNADIVVNQFAANPAFGGSPELLQEFQDDLQLLGLGNKRSFIAVMNNIKRATSEDKMLGNGGAGEQQKSMAQRMFPDMASESKPA